MRKTTLAAGAFAAWIGAVCASASAQIGTAFTYQGSLESGGAPATGNHDLTFTLWDADAAGTQQGPTIEYDAGPGGLGTINVTGGLFTAALDFGPGIFDGGARWLEISVRNEDPTDTAPYFPLSPRVALLPVPYAIRAGSAATADNVNDADADPANELQDLAGVLGQGNNAGGLNAVNFGRVAIGQISTNNSMLRVAGPVRMGSEAAGSGSATRGLNSAYEGLVVRRVSEQAFTTGRVIARTPNVFLEALTSAGRAGLQIRYVADPDPFSTRYAGVIGMGVRGSDGTLISVRRPNLDLNSSGTVTLIDPAEDCTFVHLLIIEADSDHEHYTEVTIGSPGFSAEAWTGTIRSTFNQ